ncbi:MAG: 3-methyl-2-oxobutanoate dehydrogenase subunit beta, partial [Oscillospiraceae bacterium]|nr:3-methyl-2-oxobutanoate dehydrogenase subunit beta [Oscillospiraceae bacterium]
QVTRGGGNGDYRVPVFAPSSIQEGVDLLYEAADLAQEWRNPIMLLADGMLGQMMEPVVLPEQREFADYNEIKTNRSWALKGYGDNDKNKCVVKSLRMQPDDLEAHVEKLFEKYRRAEKELVRWESFDVEDADIVFVAFGTVARLTKEAMEILAAQGIKAGLIRPISLWPFPYQAFDALTSKTKVVVSTELSMGQMIEDVRVGVNGRFPVELIHRTGGIVPTSLEVAEKAKEILARI